MNGETTPAMGDNNKIDLLLVEDSANDATLLLAELRRKGQNVVLQRVEKQGVGCSRFRLCFTTVQRAGSPDSAPATGF